MTRRARKILVRILSWSAVAAVVTVGVDFLVEEMDSSALQSRYLSSLGTQLTYTLEPGSSPQIRFPETGPYDLRLGYVGLPAFVKRLRQFGYEINRQARFSPMLERVFDAGLFTAYREKTQGGLRIFDRDDRLLFKAIYPARVYSDFASIPPLVLHTLLYIENRELLDENKRHKNPAIEWDRFGRAVLEGLAQKLGSNTHVTGGSTLATQLEKYRHSPGGQTASVGDKLRQMASASLRAYLQSPDTFESRRGIALSYVNTIPLAAARGYGEVHGLGDGLWVWYGQDFSAVNGLLREEGIGGAGLAERAAAYRDTLSLLLAQRRPAYFLGRGHKALQRLTDSYLRLLAADGIIPVALRDAALSRRNVPRHGPVEKARRKFADHKTETVLRSRLAQALGVSRLYDLDRLDLSAKSTIDKSAQQAMTHALRNLSVMEHAHAAGLVGFRLFGEGNDLSRVVYSMTLFERSPKGNLLRVQTDSYANPLDINEGVRLDLGSTAKLRTLVHYLEIVAEVHRRYAGGKVKELNKPDIHTRDRLSQWVVDQLRSTPHMTLSALLDAALERRYSANPGERFFTGGGLHAFVNFNGADNGKVLSVREGLRDSVNLVFIRIMRDIVHYHLYKPGGVGRKTESAGSEWRRKYLERFADQEGQAFLRRFYAKYRGKKPHQVMNLLAESVYPTAVRLATVYRSVFPDRTLRAFTEYLRRRVDAAHLSGRKVKDLYDKYSPERYNLHDRGYIAHIHPLELWLVAYLMAHPAAPFADVVAASTQQRQEVYQWLFKTRRQHAQNKRIQGLLEIEAFGDIHSAWQRLGYPFQTLTPSYACAIGASADRPGALAELVGILLNEGVRYPAVRFESLHFAAGTPYETVIERPLAHGQAVLVPEVAAAARTALIDVVENGTAQRLKGAIKDPHGLPLIVAGKTGTGDHRRDVYGAGGRLIESRVLNRTATFAFMLGERFFGAITAFVSGPEAARYRFTSALPVQVLKSVAPILEPVIARGESVAVRGLLATKDSPSVQAMIKGANKG